MLFNPLASKGVFVSTDVKTGMTDYFGLPYGKSNCCFSLIIKWKYYEIIVYCYFCKPVRIELCF